MARASLYFYEPGTRCMFCHAPTEESIVFGHNVSDLPGGCELVPCHRRCYLRHILPLWLQFVALSALWTAAVSVVATAGMHFLADWPWGAPPRALLWASGMIGILLGASSALRRYCRTRNEINKYIQLRTIPYD